jgi:hypothetical protein
MPYLRLIYQVGSAFPRFHQECLSISHYCYACYIYCPICSRFLLLNVGLIRYPTRHNVTEERFVSRLIFNAFHLNTRILTKLRLKKSDPHTHRSILLLLKQPHVRLQLFAVLITVCAWSPALLRNTQDGDTHTHKNWNAQNVPPAMQIYMTCSCWEPTQQIT